MTEKDDVAESEWYILPNGLRIVQQNLFQTNILYHDIFTSESYLQHGITLKNGDCVFDVGANIGMFALFAHQRCNNLKVYAFEPCPPTYEALCKNVDEYNIDTQLFNYGLSNEAKTAPILFFPNMSGMSGFFSSVEREKSVFKEGMRRDWLMPDVDEQTVGQLMNDQVWDTFFQDSQIYQCPLRTLSDVIREHSVQNIAFLKVDVEGSEVEVLQGIHQDDWQKIQQIVLEAHSRELLDQATTILERQGYSVIVEMAESVMTKGDFENPKKYRLYTVYAFRTSSGTYGGEAIEGKTTYIPVKKSVLPLDEFQQLLLDKPMPN